MRPRKPVEQKRVPFNCLVLPVTFKAILDSVVTDKVSQGVVIDRAIALMCFGDEIRSTPITSAEIESSVKTVARQDNKPAPHGVRVSRMREKGDKTR